jgi:hypothetical protein
MLLHITFCQCRLVCWRLHGADAFIFEIVERMKEENLEFERDRALKSRLIHWVAEWGGTAI